MNNILTLKMTWNLHFSVRKYGFLGTQPHPFVYTASVAAFLLRRRVVSCNRNCLTDHQSWKYGLSDLLPRNWAKCCSNVKGENHVAKGKTKSQKIENELFKAPRFWRALHLPSSPNGISCAEEEMARALTSINWRSSGLATLRQKSAHTLLVLLSPDFQLPCLKKKKKSRSF